MLRSIDIQGLVRVDGDQHLTDVCVDFVVLESVDKETNMVMETEGPDRQTSRKPVVLLAAHYAYYSNEPVVFLKREASLTIMRLTILAGCRFSSHIITYKIQCHLSDKH